MIRSHAPLAVLAAVALLLGGCGSGTGPTPAPAPARAPAPAGLRLRPQLRTQSGNVVHLERFSVFDPAAGREAFTALKPPGWNASGQVIWRQQYSNLASATLAVSDPSSGATAEVFPLIPFAWQDGGIGGFPIGSIYLGGEVRPPVGSVTEFVSQVVVPTFRSNLSVRVLDFEDTPAVSAEVAQSVQEAGLTKDVHSGRVRVEYTQNGTLIDEDFFVTLVFTRSPATGFLLWGPERIYSFRAPAGTLDDQAALLHAIVFSSRVDRQWLNEYLQVVDLYNQNQLQSIQNAADLSRLISQTNDAIMEATNQAYEERSKVNERISLEFAQTIRGVDSYADPFLGDAVELPSGYDSVWASANGDYILSNDAFYDPNVGSSIDWQPLRQVPPQP